MGAIAPPALRLAWAFISVALLAGCEPFSIVAAGVGGSAAVSHTLGGITYRTFTASQQEVKNASLTALSRMGLQVTGTARGEHGAQIVKARATTARSRSPSSRSARAPRACA